MNEEKKVIRLGGLYGNHQAGSIYDKNGISPTLDTGGGGNHQPLIVVEKYDNKPIKK